LSDSPPPLDGVLETVLYFTDQDRAERFYRDVLGMRLLTKEPGRSLFFRGGRSVFLLFNASETSKGGTLPPHGASGSIHTCFVVDDDVYPRWKSWLDSCHVEIIQEVAWSRGFSFYFEDPDGNLLEIANADIWPA
jgi:catechol 2,3-dioxygenase-like lactoylglutathione lyase family enzyme